MKRRDTSNPPKEYSKEFSPNVKRTVRLLLKHLFLHPLLFFRTFRKHDNLENHLDEYAHRVSFGRTDHPLDDIGPMESVFAALPKMIFRKSESVLSVRLTKQQDNQFIFEAKAFNIFKMMKPENFYKHVYKYQGNTPFKTLNLCIDILKDDVYRVRLQHTSEFDESFTPMVANDIRDESCRLICAKTNSAIAYKPTSSVCISIKPISGLNSMMQEEKR